MEKSLFQKYLKNLLFINIETISVTEHLVQLSPLMQQFWEKKARFSSHDEIPSTSEYYFQKAGIYAEFGRIIAIGTGYFHYDQTEKLSFRAKVLTNSDEKQLLLEFKELVEEKFPPKNLRLVAHHGKEFDFPYLCRRMIVHRITLPPTLQLSGKKSWQIEHLDTMEMWRFGDEKRYTPLRLLATIFGFYDDQQHIEENWVNRAYYHEKNLLKILEHCLEEVILTAKVFLRLLQLPDLAEENIIRLPIPNR
ncbi:MAG: ribonuclease H-like domain-containing protein [Flammeovirgaceae bacterium]|nr:ribonuclease H-like domain-containing protein [Flammeovirgaceae bacterium]MDW8287662.1 ribonuclease H-like domain-containing protein [Flammeovirgaceae bacterium]